MAASFESLGHPFVIMLTVPISFIGVVFGLLFATLLTLFVIPVVYSLFDRIRRP